MRAGKRKRVPNAAIGLILLAILALGSYVAYTKQLPWSSHFTVKAVFNTASNIRASSQVRIAGVKVGKVTGVEHLVSSDPGFNDAVSGAEPQAGNTPTSAAVVTMELDKNALPLHTDATMKLRPRLFLEGNLFVDLQPGSPNAPEADDGYTFPAGQTAVAVQLDQVLTTLQSDVRTNVQVLLKEFGNALTRYGGAEGLRELYKTSPKAFKYSSLVNEALLGKAPNDLSGLVRNLDSTVQALGRNKAALADLITNFRVVTGSFAAEDAALARAISLLPGTLRAGKPALISLNNALPSLRAFAIEALPGVRSTPATLDAATPLLRQVRGLVSRRELRGLVADLVPTIPRLTKLSRRTIPFLKQGRRLSSCFNEVVIPWGNLTIDDPETPATGMVHEELGYGLVGINGESRSGEGNGQYIRTLAGGGTNTVDTISPDTADTLHGVTPLPLLGGIPAVPSSAKPPFRPKVPCERQAVPNLNAGTPAAPPTQSKRSAAAPLASSTDLLAQAKDVAGMFDDAGKLLKSGKAKQGQDAQHDALNALGDLSAAAGGIPQSVLDRIERLAN